jgi:hypothetical protein
MSFCTAAEDLSRNMADEPPKESKGDLRKSDSRTDVVKPESAKMVGFMISFTVLSIFA